MQDKCDHLPLRRRLLTLRADQRFAEADALDGGLMIAMRNTYPSGIFLSRNEREALVEPTPGIFSQIRAHPEFCQPTTRGEKRSCVPEFPDQYARAREADEVNSCPII
jgi:hypothetical protein